MKILVLSTYYPPDSATEAEVACQQAVTSLLTRGHDARVLTVTPRMPTPTDERVIRTLKLSDVSPTNDYVSGRSLDVSNRLLEAEATGVSAYNVHGLTQVIEEFRPDAAYVWNVVGMGGLGLLATLQHLGVPWVWHLTSAIPVRLCQSRGQVVAPLVREVNRQLAGYFLASSEVIIRQVEAAGITLGDRVEVVPPWVVGPAPMPRVGFFQPGETLRVLAPGGDPAATGLLIEAIAAVRDRGYTNLTLDLHGESTDPAPPTLARRLGVRDQIRFWQPRPRAEMARVWPLHDVLALATEAPDVGAFDPLEAGWRGCVPLVAALGGHADWAVHGVHCLKAARTAQAFADSFEAILTGAIPLEPLARRAAAAVGRDFHLDAQVPRIERALSRAANQPRLRVAPGTAAEAYRLALLAEKLTTILVQEAAACA